MAKRDVVQFLEKFALPFVGGGELHVGAPIGLPELEAFVTDMDRASHATVALDDARELALAPLLSRVPAMLLEPEDLSLLAALHNALFLVHPRADTWLVTDRARRRVVDASLTMASVPLTTVKRRILGRHGLLHQLFRITRDDVALSWWTGSAKFYGQKPPSRLTAWSGLRRVATTVHHAGFAELFGSTQTAPIIATIVRRSPLTQLVEYAVGAPPLHWEDAVFMLRDHELARAVAYSLTPSGANAGGLGALWRAAAAFEQMLERTPAQADIRAVVAFLVYAEALLCIDEAVLRGGREKSVLVAQALAPGEAGVRERGAATFFALPAALANVDARLAMPPGLADDRGAADRWAIHRAQALAILGEGAIEALAARLRRHFGTAS
ncbi:MAG: hypothetical protein KBG15_04865 [Kofleriaceae bacterium]|nr:hypothetical protein [Kofleriaceae bacterium]